MSKIAAIISLASEFSNQKPTPTGFKHTIRSAKLLGFTKDETLSLLASLEFCDNQGNAFHDPFKPLMEQFMASKDKPIIAAFVSSPEPNDGMNARNMARLFKALKSGEFHGKLSAIKEVRAMLGIGLKEAKDLVEQHYYNA